MSPKKVIAWLVVAVAVFSVISSPGQSAEVVRGAGRALGEAASSLVSFVGSLL